MPLKDLNLDSGDKPSFKQIAEELKRRLYRHMGEPDEWGEGGVLTLSYEQFHSITERTQLRKRLYVEVELEACRLEIVVAFGWNAVIVATDDNFSPHGWSTSP